MKDKLWYNMFGKGKRILSRAPIPERSEGRCLCIEGETERQRQRDRDRKAQRQGETEIERKTQREIGRERLSPFLGNQVREGKACGPGGRRSCP